MLGALVVALALISPLPPSKPLPAVPPAQAATVAPVDAQSGTAQPAEEPASDAGSGTVPAGPPPRPRRLAARTGRSEREPEPAPEPSATSEVEPAGAESVALAPIPTPRPDRAEAPGPAGAAAGATSVAAAAPAATAPVEPARAATDAVPEPTDEPILAVAPEDAASATPLPIAPVPVPAERPALANGDSVHAMVETEVTGQATAPAAIVALLPAEASPAATADASAAPVPVGMADAGIAPPAPVPAERPSFIARALVAEGPESDLVVAPATDDGDSAPGLALAAMPAPPERPERPAKAEAAPVIRAMLGIPRKPDVPGFGGITPPGMICRDPRIVGAPAASFVGGIPGCGIPDPVRVESISGIRISEPALIDCRTARAFADWLTGVADPAARESLGSGIRTVSTMGSYTCRTRNNKRGERLSEHSVGRAIDIGGVTLADGRQITVRDQWGSGAAGTFLRRAWKGACGRFTTVIGPDGDRHHYNHLHLDTAYRDSTWCR